MQQQDSEESFDSDDDVEQIQVPSSNRTYQQQLLIDQFLKNRSQQISQSEAFQQEKNEIQKNIKRKTFLNFKELKDIMYSEVDKEQKIITLFSQIKNLKEAINNTNKVYLIMKSLIEIFNILAQSEENTNQFLFQMLESQTFVQQLESRLLRSLSSLSISEQLWIDEFVNSLCLIQQKYNTAKQLPIDIFHDSLSMPQFQIQFYESIEKLKFLKQVQQDQIISELKRNLEQKFIEKRKNQFLQQENIKIDYKLCPCEPVQPDFTLSDHLDDKQSFGQLISADQQFGYYSSELYLNNNFYILREDYLRDFRNAVKQVMHFGLEKYEKSLNRNMYIYRTLYVDSIQFNFSGILFFVSFIPISNRIINWPKSNRLRPGSLLLLTTEPFEEMYFAQVIQRKTELKANSKEQPVELYIKLYNLQEKFNQFANLSDETSENEEFENQVNAKETSIQSFGEFVLKNYKKIIIFENKIFFEPYIHHLQCIQSKSLQFPFYEQIILNNYQQQKPGYIETSYAHYKINLNFKLNEKKVNSLIFRRQQQEIDIFGEWNLATKGSLDESQFQAIKSMLTSQISLIQGPPGTGKTYCGALGVKLLLENWKFQISQTNESRGYRLRRNGQKSPPILIVCHTNHALDQFLRHILTFVKPEDLVRIGGRCKDEELKKCMLKQINIHFDFKQFHKLKDQLNTHLKNVLNYNQRIDWYKFMPKCCTLINNYFLQFNKLQFERPLTHKNQNTIFYDWLLGTDIDDESLIDEVIDVEKDNDNLLLSEIEQNQQKKKKQKRQFMRKQQNQNQFELFQQNSDDGEEEEDQHLEHSDSDDERDQVNNDQDIEKQIQMLQYQEQQEQQDQQEKQEKQEQKEQQEYLQQEGINQNQEEKTQQQKIQQEIKFQMPLEYPTDQYALDCDLLYHIQLQEEADIWNCQFINKYQVEDIIRLEYFNQIINSYKIVKDQNEFIEMIEKYNEKKEQSDMNQIADAKIVGVTVTGCAKYAKKLTKLGIKIMIIEEAAEVLESHTASILSESLQHLIMIGDHQQLKPKLESYYLEKKYRTNISLFERLVNNKFPYVTLSTQRRMKTKFSNIIRS